MIDITMKSHVTKIGTNLPIQSCVIFIHGIGGAASSWGAFVAHLDSQWDAPDSFGIEYDEYMIEINIGGVLGNLFRLVGGGPNIELLANSLRTTIEQVCKNYSNVIIVAHSMGGLIARKYLVDLVKKTKNVGRIKALITYATPHRGSRIATIYKRYLVKYFFFPFYLSSKQIYDMCRRNSAFISQLNNDWETLRIDTQLDFLRVVGYRDWVVDIESAEMNGDDPFCFPIANRGHFNIIVPFKVKDPAFLVTFNYLLDFRQNLENKIEKEELDLFEEEDQTYDDFD